MAAPFYWRPTDGAWRRTAPLRKTWPKPAQRPPELSSHHMESLEPPDPGEPSISVLKLCKCLPTRQALISLEAGYSAQLQSQAGSSTLQVPWNSCSFCCYGHVLLHRRELDVPRHMHECRHGASICAPSDRDRHTTVLVRDLDIACIETSRWTGSIVSCWDC